eukprot:SAG22_NODE_1978_length_3212_cov_3.220045_7_plen_109_part_00
MITAFKREDRCLTERPGAAGELHVPDVVGGLLAAWSSRSARRGTVLDRKVVEAQQKGSASVLTRWPAELPEELLVVAAVRADDVAVGRPVKVRDEARVPAQHRVLCKV